MLRAHQIKLNAYVVTCRFLPYLQSTVHTATVWSSVILAVERCSVILCRCDLHRHRLYLSVLFFKYLIIFVVSASVNVPYFFTQQLVHFGHFKVCWSLSVSGFNYANQAVYYSVMKSVLPFLVALGCSIVMFCVLRRREMSLNGNVLETGGAKVAIHTVIVISIRFMLFVLPAIVLFILNKVCPKMVFTNFVYGTPFDMVVNHYGRDLSHFCIVMNFSTNLLFICFVNRHMRRNVVKTLQKYLFCLPANHWQWFCQANNIFCQWDLHWIVFLWLFQLNFFDIEFLELIIKISCSVSFDSNFTFYFVNRAWKPFAAVCKFKLLKIYTWSSLPRA